MVEKRMVVTQLWDTVGFLLLVPGYTASVGARELVGRHSGNSRPFAIQQIGICWKSLDAEEGRSLPKKQARQRFPSEYVERS